MKVGIIQINILPRNPEENFNQIRKAVLERKDSEICIVPEMWDYGFDYETIVNNAVSWQKNPLVKKMQELSKQAGCVIIGGSVAERQGDKLFNTTGVFGETGEVLGIYRKIHLFTKTGEDKVFSSGDSFLVFEFKGFRCGVITCYDIRFPLLCRALKDIDILFHHAQFPHPRKEQYRILVQARSLDCQCYTVSCNRTGKDDCLSYFGNSMIVDPEGNIIGELEEKQGILEREIFPLKSACFKKSIQISKDEKEFFIEKFDLNRIF